MPKRLSQEETRLQTILVPIDFSAASLYPIQWAKFISRRTKAKIHLVHVHDFPYPLAVGFTPPMVGSEAEINQNLQRDLVAVASSQRVGEANFHIRVGRPVDEICRLAREIAADLIVLATHGRTGWERAFLGSTRPRRWCDMPPARYSSRGKAGRVEKKGRGCGNSSCRWIFPNVLSAVCAMRSGSRNLLARSFPFLMRSNCTTICPGRNLQPVGSGSLGARDRSGTHGRFCRGDRFRRG